MGRARLFLGGFLLLLAGIAVADDSKRIIMVQSMPVPPVLNHSAAFVKHLAALGYVEGSNLRLDILRAEGDRARAERMLREALAEGRPDLVVTSATLASQVAAKLLQGTDVPQIFYTVSDPAGAGLVPAIGVPTGSGITGKLHTLARKVKIEMVLRVLGGPAAKKPLRFGFIHSSYPSSLGDARLLREAATDYPGVRFVFFRFEYRPVPEGLPGMLEDVRRGIHALENQVDYWWEPSGPEGERIEYTRLLRDHSTRPVVFGTNMDCVRHGALLHVTPGDDATGREAAELAVAILRGAAPGDFPVTPPREIDLGLNLATALAMGIAVPSDMVELAGPHIFREQAP